jgi:uncharacterized protein (TIGR02145 family)
MRKLILTTATVAAAIAGAFADETAFGTFTDTRDGQTYKTVKIGKQTWMAQNLNYKTPRNAQRDFIYSHCYENKKSNCKKYGRLYNRSAARTVCPAGWKLPDTADWRTLVTTAGGPKTAGKKLKSISGWNDYEGKSGNGTNDFGFSAIPSGYNNYNRHFYIFCCNSYDVQVGRVGQWWTATGHDDFMSMKYYDDYADIEGDDGRIILYNAVRCVADAP